MAENWFADHSILLNQKRLAGVLFFVCGFFVCLYLWQAARSKNYNPRFFLSLLSHSRTTLLKSFFTEGPGYLVLPLLLIAASILEQSL